MRGDTRYLRIWGTHLRWAALCREAWEIVFSGGIPSTTMTPPIVQEYGKKIHDKMVTIIAYRFRKMPQTLHISLGDSAIIEYSISLGLEGRQIVVSLKPDLYVLWSTPRGPINLAIEVTTRQQKFIPDEWLTAYSLGYYIRNLRPSFTVLVTPQQTMILPLSTENVERLGSLIYRGTRNMPTSSLCYNCDLRQICPNPII